MRADRLVAIVLLLQTHGQLTAGQLADMLETSERTIRRDLDSLLVAGLPLYSQRGRGGGWALLGGHRIDMTGLTAQEARALFLLAGGRRPRRSAGDAGAGLRSALRKVMAALPEPLRAEAAAAEAASLVDPAGWGQEPEEAPGLPLLQEAVLTRRQAVISYAKPGQAAEGRRVHPLGLVSKRGVWYLVAGTAAGRRTFRVSRVQHVELTDEPAEVPERFDLAEEWQRIEADFAARMATVQVRLEASESVVLGLTSALGGWTEVREEPAKEPGDDSGTGPLEAGWRRFRVAFPHPRAAAFHLAPYGAQVRVLSPPEVRRHLREIGQALVVANPA